MTALVAPVALAALSFAACAPRATDVSVADGDPVDAAAHADARADADTAGRCVPGGTNALEPVTVACGQTSPARLVTDADHVYWTVQGAGPVVLKASLAGGPPETLVYDGAAAVGLVVDATFVYYTQPSLGRVMRVPIGGGVPVALATGLDWPLFLALDNVPGGATLFWTGGQQTTGTITKLALAAGAKPITLIDGQSRPRALAAQGGFVYWTDFSDGTILRTPERAPDPDGGVRVGTRLAAGLRGPSDLALAGGFVYVPDQAGRIARVLQDGGDLQTIADVDGIPFGVATDGRSIYWSTLGDGGIFRTKVEGRGPIDTLAGAQADPHFLALSSIAVFWSTWGHGGAIHKIAK